jgi:hypothetical protein
MSAPDPALARQILQRVGEIGQPPEVGVEHLNVGNESLLRVLDREYLEPIATLGREYSSISATSFQGRPCSARRYASAARRRRGRSGA